MQKYRQRTSGAECEAVQLTKENVAEVAEWCTGKEVEETDALEPDKKYVGVVLITAIDGNRMAGEGDYICKDTLGSFHVRWPENFERDFEVVDDDGQAG